MGRISLISRLAARDLRQRPAEAALVLVALVVASTTLTLGLLLKNVTADPYNRTRAETNGPDVVADATPPPNRRRADLPALLKLAGAPGVIASAGPFPLVQAVVRSHGHAAAVQLEGREARAARVDMPKLSQGSWVRPGRAVVERSFATAFSLRADDRIVINGRAFVVAGVAVSAAIAPYPLAFCLTPCAGEPPPAEAPSTTAHKPEAHPGLIWLTRADLRAVAPSADPKSYVLNLKLARPSTAPAFVDRESSPAASAPSLEAWQNLSEDDANLIRNERRVLLTGSSLLALLALASIAVLVGGRMSEQVRRVGLLKAVGASPALIAAVLLAEYMVLAVIGAVAGLSLGTLVSPLLTSPGAGLLGSARAASITAPTVELVIGVAFGVAGIASFFPAWRAARTSTVLALADSPRAPRRGAWVIAVSARFPVALMLGFRLTSRRPRRAVLCCLSVAIAAAGIVAVLAAHAQLDAQTVASTGLANPRADLLNQVLVVITLMLIAMAAVNVIFITWVTTLDAKHSSALERALGATPSQLNASLCGAQVLPALAGAILGIPAGIVLFDAVSPDKPAHLSLALLAAVVLAAPLVIALLAAIPARLGARRAIAEVLRAELT